MRAVQTAEVQAALDRAVASLLMQAMLGETRRFEEVRRVARELRLVLDGRWIGSAPYQPSPLLQAAWAALPVGIEWMPMFQVQKFLSSQGVELAADDVSHLEVDAGQQLEHAEGAAFDLQQEQAAGRVHGHYGAGQQVASHGGAL